MQNVRLVELLLNKLADLLGFEQLELQKSLRVQLGASTPKSLLNLISMGDVQHD